MLEDIDKLKLYEVKKNVDVGKRWKLKIGKKTLGIKKQGEDWSN